MDKVTELLLRRLADLETNVRELRTREAALGGFYARGMQASLAIPSTSQTVPNALVIEDIRGITFVPGTYYYTVQYPGRYLATSTVYWVSNATGMRSVYITMNGLTAAYSRLPAVSGYVTATSIVGVRRLAAGQAAAIYLEQNSGVTLNAEVQFTLDYIGP